MDRNKIRERFREEARADRLSHAYILEDRQQEQARELASYLAALLLCEDAHSRPCGVCPSCRRAAKEEHEDLILVRRQENSLKDEDVEKMQERLGKKPYRGRRNVAVILDADLMTQRAQNRLLKTLEEPPGQAVIILVSGNAEHLLPTVLSRCVLYHLDESQSGENACADGAGTPEGETSAEAKACRVTGLLLKKRPFFEVSSVIGEEVKDKEKAYGFLDALEIYQRDLLFCSLGMETADETMKQQSRLLAPEKLYRAAVLIEEARRDLNRNINTGYALKGMLLSMMEY